MSRADRRGRGALLATAVLAAAVLTACSGSSAGRATAATAAAAGSASYEQLTQAFLTYARCARTHGMPDLPDPVVDQQGNDTYPPLTRQGSPRWTQSVLRGCAAAWDHVHQVRADYDSSHGLAARDSSSMTPARLLAFSRCIRTHGFPGYPDPGPDGNVADQPPGFQKPNLSPAAIAAIQGCTAQVGRG